MLRMQGEGGLFDEHGPLRTTGFCFAEQHPCRVNRYVPSSQALLALLGGGAWVEGSPPTLAVRCLIHHSWWMGLAVHELCEVRASGHQLFCSVPVSRASGTWEVPRADCSV